MIKDNFVTVSNNECYSHLIESTATRFYQNDGKLKIRLGLSHLDSKVCLIAVKIIEKEDESVTSIPESTESENHNLSTITSDPNWAYLRTRSNGTKVFISVSSAAKRLFKSKEEIINSCSNGLFLNLYAQESGMIFNLYYRRASKNLHIPPSAIDFLNHNKEALIALAKRSENGYTYQKFREFPRPVEVRDDGSILVHFTKTLLKFGRKGDGDLFFGEGSFKKARTAVLFNGPNAGAMRLITSFNLKSKTDSLLADHEAAIHAKVSGKPGVLKLYREYKVIGSNGNAKSFMDLEFCEKGELFDSIHNNDLSPKDKISIILDLLDGMVSLQEAGILHNDIKVENIFLRQKGDRIRAKIGDFGLSSAIDDASRKKNCIGSIYYTDPEYLKAVSENNITLIENYSNQKLDIYSFGVVLYALTFRCFFKGQLPEKTMSIDENPLIHLMHDCLAKNQDERIDAKSAHEKYFSKFQALFKSMP